MIIKYFHKQLLFIITALIFNTGMYAQFTLTFSGNTTIAVGDNCTAPLEWGHPDNIMISSTAGNVTSFDIFSITNNLNIGDNIPANNTVSIVYVASDDAGNTDTLSNQPIILSFQDLSPPVFDSLTLPSDSTYASLSLIPNPPDISTVTATDNCTASGDIVITFLEETPPSLCDGGTFIRTWTAFDFPRNEASYEQTITILQDTDPPTWDADPDSIVIECTNTSSPSDTIAVWLAANGNAQLSDISDSIIVTTDSLIFSNGCGDTGTAIVTFTATDSCGNASSRIATVTIQDNTPPLINPIARDTTVSCGADTLTFEDWMAFYGGALAFDNCTQISNAASSAHWSIVNIDTVQGCSNSADYTVSFEVRDDCDNRDTTMATFTLIDDLAPIIGAINDTTAQCNIGDAATVLENWLIKVDTSIFLDGCGGFANFVQADYTTSDAQTGTWTNMTTPFPITVPSNDCNWFAEVAFLFDDECGNQAADTARFSLIDINSPLLAGIPSDTTVSCDNIPGAPLIGTDITASDECDTDVAITFSDSTITTTNGFILTRIWTATDDCLNSTEFSQLITVVDTIAPVLSGNFPADTTVRCDAIPSPPNIGTDITATDNCDTTIPINLEESNTQHPNIDSCGHYNYVLTRSWIAIDDASNADTITQLLTIIDTLPPTFIVPIDITVLCDETDSINITGIPSMVNAACDTLPIIVFADSTLGGLCAATDTIIRTWTVTDACGNLASASQTIVVIDTVGPTFSGIPIDTIIPCGSTIPSVPVANVDIIGIDNCSNAIVQFLSETNTQGNNPNNCDFYNFDILRTWQATDDCGNTSLFTQTIAMLDTTPPIIQCVADQVLPNDLGFCGATYTLPDPFFFFDECTGTSSQDTLSQTSLVVNTSGDPNSSPVDAIVFNFNIDGAPPEKVITDNVFLDITLINVDGEQATEVFQIEGEGNVVLGETALTNTQCGNSTVTITLNTNLVNTWAADSIITITLVPLSSGTGAINAVCPNSSVNGVLKYEFVNANSSLTTTFQIDNGAEQSFTTPSVFLSGGSHTITYFATDCSGNKGNCSFNVTINDTEPPFFDCPTSIMTFADLGTCDTNVDLPIPSGFSDNCGFADSYNETQTQFITFVSDPNISDLVPQTIFESFAVAVPDAVGDAQLTVSFIADVADTGEFFEVFGESNMLLGTSNIGNATEECNTFVSTNFTIPKDSINAWASDGTVSIAVISNKNAASFTDFVNPCAPVNINGIDSTSIYLLRLSYPNVQTNYEVFDADSIRLDSGTITSVDDIITLNLPTGNNTATYSLEDASGNVFSCSFDILVQDTILPQISCISEYTLQTFPSGLITEVLTTDDLVTSFSDNCNIDSLFLSQNNFTCLDADNTVEIVATIKDGSNNSATCTTNVSIMTENLTPSFVLGACSDTLFLFADTTFATLPGTMLPNLSYEWGGPLSYSSFEKNPFIPGLNILNSGTYNLTITGNSGCTSTGNLFINVNDLPSVPTIMAEDNNICSTEAVILTTQPVTGTNVQYYWFEGTPPTGIPFDTTISPVKVLTNVAAGTHLYYVEWQDENCTSTSSSPISITVTDAPQANTNDPFINICEGESIVLESLDDIPGFVYTWRGPNGYFETGAQPLIIQNADGELHAGTYDLIVSDGECDSDPDFTVVSITERPGPEQPQIANLSGDLCEKDNLTLSTDITDATTYTWINLNVFDTFTTNSNQLILPQADLNNAGNWIVSATALGCSSNPSNIVSVNIEPLPGVNPHFEGNPCDGENIILISDPDLIGATYDWLAPDGTPISGNNASTPALDGSYKVTVTLLSGCSNVSSLDVNLSTPPTITAFSSIGGPCISPGVTDIILTPTISPPDTDNSYTYFWVIDGDTVMNSDSIFVLSNETASTVNGTYSLIVQNAEGCRSESESTMVVVTDIPTPSPVLQASSTALCQGESITFTTTTYPDIVVEYQWNINGIINMTTFTPTLTIDSVFAAMTGTVSVTVVNGECSAAAPATIDIEVYSTPVTPAITNGDTIIGCTSSSIILTTDSVSGATYQWEGPDPFNSATDIPQLTLDNLDVNDDAGMYTVQLIVNGCESEISDPALLNINELPPAPIANNSGDVCLDTESVIVLFIDGDTIDGVSYTWYLNTDTNPVEISTTSNLSIFVPLNGFIEGTYEFVVTQTLNGCTSDMSAPTSVILSSIPTETPIVCNTQDTICSNESAILCAISPTVGTGRWTAADPEVSINNPDNAQTTASGLIAGNTYTFNWILSNGACTDYAQTEMVVTVSNVDAITQVSSSLIEDCDASELTITANSISTDFTGTWSQPNGQSVLGVTIVSPNSVSSLVTGIPSGTPFNSFTFFWEVSDGSCSSRDTLVSRIYSTPNETAETDDTFISCDSTATLSATSVSGFISGEWSALDENIVINNPNNITTTVDNLANGANTFVWTLSNGACVNYSDDTLIVYFEQAPLAIADNFTVAFSDSLTFDVSLNDIFSSPEFEINIIQQPTFGTLTNLGNGGFQYIASPDYTGDESFEYELCSPTCATECATATVSLLINDRTDCFIPTIITPNNDGINDAFVVPCLTAGNFPSNQVIIFNQWGDEVFKTDNYNNDWMGTYKGDELPVGTYFYIVDFGRGEEPQTGFLLVER